MGSTIDDGRCSRCVSVTADLAARMGTLAALDECAWRVGADARLHWAHEGDDFAVCGEAVASLKTRRRK